MSERMIAPKDWQPGWKVDGYTVERVSIPVWAGVSEWDDAANGGWVLVKFIERTGPICYTANPPVPVEAPDELVYRVTHGTGYTFWSSEPPSADAINFGDPRSKCEVGRVEWLGPYAGDEKR